MTPSPHERASTTLAALFRRYDGPSFSIRLWDGWTWSSAMAEAGRASRSIPVCTLVLTTPAALETLLASSSQMALGEAFLRKQLDVEGDLFSAFAVAEHLLRRPRPKLAGILTALSGSGFAARRTAAQGRQHSATRDRSSIAWHYDQPVEFFRQFLGPTLVYSCAYFQDPSDSLDEAQVQKLDHICRKLRLRRGQRLLDIGCGWGSLVLHAAGHYAVKATGITLSHRQEETAQQRIRENGFDTCCQVRLQDYRQLDPAREQYDAIASVGMAEHVGLRNLPIYFRVAHSILRAGGVFLNHAIARSETGAAPRGQDSFIGRYVFPDGELVTLNEMLRAAEQAGFEVRDVENLREHYQRTLRCWVEALRAHEADVLQLVSETTYRIWLLYMAGCASAFRSGDIAIFQTLLSRPDRGRSGLPLTRDDWYAANGA
jgi:cyclopropane-fatty-acyl-phospholipid synthase